MTQQVPRVNPNLWVQLLIVVLSRGATFMVMPFVSILMGRQFGLSPTKIGLIVGVSAFLGSLAGFYGGYISDRFGRKAVMYAALSLYAVAFLTLAYTRSIWLFVPVFLLVGTARSLFEPASEAFVSDLSVGAKQKEFMFTMRFLCINIAAAIAPYAAVTYGLGAEFDTFLVTAAIFIGAIALLKFGFYRFPVPPESVAAKKTWKETVRVFKGDKPFAIYVLGILLAEACYIQYSSTLPMYLDRAAGQTGVKLFGELMMLNAVAILVLQLPIMRLTASFAPIKVVQAGILFFAAAYFSMAFCDPLTAWPWYVSTLLLSIGETMVFAKMKLFVDQIAPSNMRGSYFGAASLAVTGLALGQVLGGWWLDALGSTNTFIATGVMGLGGLWLVNTASRMFQSESVVRGSASPVV